MQQRAAEEFLDQLAEASLSDGSVGKERLFVVPGNHDVVFDEENLGRRWEPYCAFFGSLFSGVRKDNHVLPKEAGSLSRIIDLSAQGIIVAELNSCLYVRKGSDDENRGQIDFEALDNLENQLETLSAETRSRCIKIALVHHHPVLLPTLAEPGRGYDAVVNAEDLLALLRDNKFHIVVHGHKHLPQIFPYAPTSAFSDGGPLLPLLIAAGGSAGSRMLPSGQQACNTYNLISLQWYQQEGQLHAHIVTRGLVTRKGRRARPLNPARWHWGTIHESSQWLMPHNKSHTPPPGGSPLSQAGTYTETESPDNADSRAGDLAAQIDRAELPRAAKLDEVLFSLRRENYVVVLAHQGSRAAEFTDSLKRRLEAMVPQRQGLIIRARPGPSASVDEYVEDVVSQLPLPNAEGASLTVVLVHDWSNSEEHAKHQEALGKKLRAMFDPSNAALQRLLFVAIGGYRPFLFKFCGKDSIFNSADIVRLEDLTAEEIYEFMHEIEPGRWSREGAEDVWNRTGGHPGLVKRLLCASVGHNAAGWAEVENIVTDDAGLPIRSALGRIHDAASRGEADECEAWEELRASFARSGWSKCPWAICRQAGHRLYFDGLMGQRDQSYRLRDGVVRKIVAEIMGDAEEPA